MVEWQKRNTEYVNKKNSVWKKKNGEKVNKYNTAWRMQAKESNPELWKEREFRSGLKKHYGVTPEWYSAQLSSQKGVCALCGNQPGEKRLAVDHSHVTNQVRGLLCTHCNTGLHKMEENLGWIRKAEAYLLKHAKQGTLQSCFHPNQP